MGNDLSRLILLQKLDVEIRQLQDEVTSLPLRQEELERQFAAAVTEYLGLKNELETAQTGKRELEARIEEEQQRHRKFKNDLMKSTNEREYTTAVREIDVARKVISQHETEILKLMEQIEKLEANLAEKTPAMEIERQEVDRQLGELRARATNAAARMEELRSGRPAIYDTLSTDARSNYDRLSRMKSGLALAEARDYSCRGCRMSIRPQVYNDIRRGDKIIMCENCGRILFFTEDAA